MNAFVGTGTRRKEDILNAFAGHRVPERHRDLAIEEPIASDPSIWWAHIPLTEDQHALVPGESCALRGLSYSSRLKPVHVQRRTAYQMLVRPVGSELAGGI